MKYVKNESDTARRVDDGTGRLLRVGPNAVAAVPDNSNLDVDSISEVSKEDFESHVASGNPSTAVTKDQVVQDEIAETHRRLGQITVAVPLAQVIGDSDAPLGPDNGTITTKQEAAKESPEAKRAFADHENIDTEKVGLSEVEVLQAEAKAAVDEVAKDLQGKHEEAVKESSSTSKRGKKGSQGTGTITTAQTSGT